LARIHPESCERGTEDDEDDNTMVSLRARYICIVAVQHCHSSKFDLLILSKLVAVKKSVFTSSHVLLQYNSSIFWGAMKRYLREPAEKHSKSKCPSGKFLAYLAQLNVLKISD